MRKTGVLRAAATVGVAVAALCGVILASAPAFAAPPPKGSVRPILECVWDNGDGTYTAVWGYDNTTGATVTLDVGAQNNFAPLPQDRGQPTVFDAGRRDNAFTVANATGNLTWHLNGVKTTARASSTACSSNPTVPIGVNSPFGLAIIVVLGFGATAWIGRSRLRLMRDR